MGSGPYEVVDAKYYGDATLRRLTNTTNGMTVEITAMNSAGKESESAADVVGYSISVTAAGAQHTYPIGVKEFCYVRDIYAWVVVTLSYLAANHDGKFDEMLDRFIDGTIPSELSRFREDDIVPGDYDHVMYRDVSYAPNQPYAERSIRDSTPNGNILRRNLIDLCAILRDRAWAIGDANLMRMAERLQKDIETAPTARYLDDNGYPAHTRIPDDSQYRDMVYYIARMIDRREAELGGRDAMQKVVSEVHAVERAMATDDGS